MRYRLPDGSIVQGYMCMQELLELLERHGAAFAWEVNGSPEEDEDYAAQVRSLRRSLEQTDMRDRQVWWSVSGCSKWPHIEASRTRRVQDWLCEQQPNADLGRAVKGCRWEDAENDLLIVGEFPKTVYAVLSRYGYSVESDFGEAPTEDAALNRMVSALYGYPASDFSAQDLNDVNLTCIDLAILREWFGWDCNDPEIEHARIRHDAGVIPEPVPEWVRDPDLKGGGEDGGQHG